LRQALEYKTPLMSEYSHFLDKIERQMLRILSALDMDDKVIFRYLVRNCTVYDDVFDEMEIFGRNCLVQPCGLDTENMFEIYVYIQKKFIENWKNAYKFLNYLKSLDKFIYCQKFSLGKNCSIYMQFVPVNYTFHQLTEVNPRSIIDISKNKNGSKTKILVERLEPYKRMKNLGIDVKYADILSVVSEDNNDFDRYCMMLNRRNGKQVFGIHFDKLDFSKFNYKLCFFRADCMRVAEKDYKPEWSFGCDRFNDESVCPIENFVQYISNTPGKMFFSYMPPGEDKNDDKPVVLVAFDSTVTGFDGVEYFVMLHSHHMQTDSIEDEFSEENDYSLKD